MQTVGNEKLKIAPDSMLQSCMIIILTDTACGEKPKLCPGLFSVWIGLGFSI